MQSTEIRLAERPTAEPDDSWTPPSTTVLRRSPAIWQP